MFVKFFIYIFGNQFGLIFEEDIMEFIIFLVFCFIKDCFFFIVMVDIDEVYWVIRREIVDLIGECMCCFLNIFLGVVVVLF